MTKTSLICGSIAFDKIMQYHGRFGETLLADQLHRVNVSFLVTSWSVIFQISAPVIVSAIEACM